MNTNRIWVLGSVVIIVVILAATWFLGVSPQLATAALSTSDRVAVEAQNTVAQSTVASLKAQYENIDELTAELDAARVGMPSAKNQSPLLRDIGTYAKAAKVKVVSVSFQDPTPYIDGQSLDPELAGALGLVSSANFLVIPIELTVKGDYSKVMSFVDKLQHGDRIVLVHDLGMGEGGLGASDEVSIAISAETFVLLDSASVPSVEAPADPAAAVPQ